MKAIIYTTNTGTTQKYAELLGEKLSLPVYDMKSAPALDGGVVYMGWVMANTVSGLTEALAKFDVRAICAVGMAPEAGEKTMSALKEKNPTEAPLFYLPGAFDMKKLSGMYKMMMSMVVSKMKSEIKKKDMQGEAADKVISMFTDGVDYFDEKHLQPVLEALQ